MTKTDLSKLTWRQARAALKQARLDRGWTQENLANATDYTKGRISQAEKVSDESIASEYLDRVIPALGYDSLANLLDGDPRRLTLPLALRSAVGTLMEEPGLQIMESVVHRALEPVRIHRILSNKLSSRDPVLPLLRMPEPRTRDRATLQGREAAYYFRDFLGVSSSSPVLDLGRLLGRLGVAILECELPDGILGALVGNSDDGYSILYSTQSQIKRQRFTVAHELGHLVMDGPPHVYLEKPKPKSKRKTPSTPKERRANAFAAALMLPERWVDRLAAGLGVLRRARGERPWRSLLLQLSYSSGASESACAYELRDLHYISEDELHQALEQDDRYNLLGQLENNLDHLLLGKTMAAVESHRITPRKGLEILHPVWHESTAAETGYQKREIETMLRSLLP